MAVRLPHFRHKAAMKISVIIPVYGVEAYVRDCLASVGAQITDCEVECVIVDDKGPDRSMDIVREFVASYRGNVGFKIVEREKNGGLSAARNSGLDAAGGTHVCFLDSDDELPAGALQALANAMRTMDCDIIIADYATTGATREYPRNHIDGGTRLTRPQTIGSYCNFQWFMMVVSKLYKRSFIEQNRMKFVEGVLFEDEIWSFQCASRAESIGIISDICYTYKIRPGSITSSPETDIRRRINSEEIIFKTISHEIKSHGIKYSKAVHQFMRIKLSDFFKRYAGHLTDKERKEYYREFRRHYPAPWRRCAVLDGFHRSKQRLDFHLALPCSLGYRYFKHLNYLTQHG